MSDAQYLFYRYKGESPDEDKQVAFALADANKAECQGEFAERDCQIDIENGDLTLGRIHLTDEGSYTCRKAFKDSGSDSLYRIRYLNVNGELLLLGH